MSLLELDELGGVNEGWDWDTFEKDPRLELWVVRVPKGVRVCRFVLTLPSPGCDNHINIRSFEISRSTQNT